MKQTLVTRILFVLITFSIFSCDSATTDDDAIASDSKAGSFNLTAVKDTIEVANKRFVDAILKGDSVTAADNYTSDAKILAPNMPVVTGRDGMVGFASGFSKSGLKSFRLNVVDVWGNDEFVTEEGTYNMADANGKTMDQGKYLVLWKKENGKWKIFRDIFNSDMPVIATGH